MAYYLDLGSPASPIQQQDPPVAGLDNPAYIPATSTDNVQSLLGPAFRTENVIGSLLSSPRQVFPDEPGYNPLDDIRGTPYYNNHLDRFYSSGSHQDTLARMSQIDREEADRKRLAEGGVSGLVAGAIAGSMDPTLLLPGRVAVGGIREGVGALRGAMEVGGAMAVQSAAQEAAFQGTQQTRSLEDSIASVGTATLLGALTGPALSLLSPAARAATERGLEQERSELDAHVAQLPELATGAPMAQPAGAAATDTRTLNLVPTLPGQDAIQAGLDRVRQVPILGRLAPASLGIEKVGWDPVMRALNQPSLAWRRAVSDLAEIPALVMENLRGETTTLSGQMPLETARRLLDNDRITGLNDTLQRLWGDLRFSGERIPLSERAKLLFNVAGSGDEERAPSFSQFKTLVSDAMMNGDTHHVPQVQEAAQWIRKNIFDPWADRAEKAIPGFERTDAESYFPHVWNKALIAAKRPEFVNRLVDKYMGDNSAKMAAQQRLRAYAGALDEHSREIEASSRKLAAREARLEDDEALRDEVSKFNRFAFTRAGTLREAGAPPVTGRRGGAPFETMARARINELSDRAQGHLAAVSELEDRIASAQASADAVREKIEGELQAWQGGSAREAQAALDARAAYDAERQAAAAAAGREPPTTRLTSADDAVDTAVRRILGRDYDRPVQEVRDQAQETVNRILGSPDGRLQYEERQGSLRFGAAPGEQLRGSLAARPLDVTNEWARDWIERDVEKVVANHQRAFVPDVLLAERFGDIEMTEQRRAIQEEYNRLIDQAGPDETVRKRLDDQRNQALADLTGLRDRFRGMFAVPSTGFGQNIGRISANIRNANVMLSLGMATVSSLGDAAGSVFRYGLMNTMRDGWAPFVTSLMANREYTKEALDQMRVMANATDTISASRHHEFSGLAEAYTPQSPLERTLQWGADKFNIVNLLGPWTDMVKTISGTVAANYYYRAAKAAAEGTADAKQLRALGEGNISAEMRPRIAEQYEKFGTNIDGHILPNTREWTDRAARDAFEAAISRDANISVVTPGLDKPLLFSDPAWAMLMQFKSFTAAATTRLMIANMQRRDAETLSGLIASLGLGMVSYKLSSIASGTPTSDRPQDWIKEAMSRGNVLGWLEEANTLAAKSTRGQVDIYRAIGADKPLSKFASQNAVEQLLGPTIGKMSDATKAVSAASTGDWSAADTAAVRRLIPGQNLFYLRRLFGMAGDGLDQAFGIPDKAPAAR